jgi:L-arabinose isomerase
MIVKRKPRIGLLGIMHGLYDKSQPEITRSQEAFAREVAAHLEDSAEIDFPGAAKSREDIEEIMGSFGKKNYDGIMIVMLLYSPGLRLVRALENNNLPLLLANIQPLPAVSADWDWSRLTTNQGIHGAQDTANMIVQAGKTFSVITDHWKSPEFKSAFTDWAMAAQAASGLRKMRLAVFGRMKGMGDIVGDEGVLYRTIGPEINHEGIGQVYDRMQSASEKEIDALVAEDRRNFEIDPALPEENHRYALKLQMGFEKFLQDFNYDGFSVNFDTFMEDGRFKQIHMLAASNLMARGYAYSNEGDVHSACIVGAGHLLIGDAHFTEMYSLDFEKDSALMSHMGEGNWKIAREDRPIRLIDRELEIGGLSNPPTVVFSAKPGPATLVSLASIAAKGYRLVVSGGEILDTPQLAGVPMPYFHFHPTKGIRSSMDNWLLQGGTHHQALNLGDYTRRWEMLCRILDIECVMV